MKYTLLPVWAALALAGGLFAASPAQAGGASPPPTASPLLPVPGRPTATGLARPIDSQIQLSWLPVPRTNSYKVYRDGQFLAAGSRASWTDYNVAAGETHAYAVTSLGATGESHPSPTATATVPVGGGQVVYADSLQNGWQSWGWASMDLGSTTLARAGCAIRVTAGPSQALYLHHAPFSTSAYAAVTFWIHGGSQGGQRLCVKALRSGVPQAAVPLGPLPAGQWQSVTIPLSRLGVAGVVDMDGLWVQDASGTSQPAFFVDEIALTATPPAPAAPPAPAGLTATPQWAASCPVCGGMAMAHIVLGWNAVPGASSYAVYRDGTKVKDGLAAPAWTDMNVVSGHTYSYAVTATGPGGESARSASVSAAAPQPPAGQAMLTAPTNLSVTGVWSGSSTDLLAWSPVPGAVSYNLYLYDLPLTKGLTTTSYAVPPDLFCWGLTYTVTAVDAMGMESLPSAVATAQGRTDPTWHPVWMPDPPAVPTALAAAPEWNAGVPRIHLTWRGKDTDFTYNLYRDGRQVASGLWGLNYYDADLHPGETHAYSVSGVNLPWTAPIESLPSAPLTATAPLAAPAPLSAPVQIISVLPNDDSALVSFAPVPGAADYRVYDAAHPASVKYSGGSLSIEMNGLDPVNGADLVVEAVDKLGPFQKMDGMAGPGAMQMDGMHSAINGQGDPSDIPLVLAASAPFHVTCRPVSLTGSQVFFDDFRAEQPLAALPCPAPIPGDTGGEYGHPYNYSAAANDKWEVRQYAADMTDTKVFFMGNHFMDTLYDGSSPHAQGPVHNNNASLVMMPKTTADISGGRVLHVTFEVDAHMDGRRWCDVIVAPASDILMNPAKLDGGLSPTTSGTMFRWEIKYNFHIPAIFTRSTETDLVAIPNGVCEDVPTVQRIVWWNGQPLTNGSAQDLDKRHRFDLYLSHTHFRLMESGQLVKDGDFPAGQPLPFDQCQVYFVHQLYHTSNDRNELLDWDPADSYWYNYRPWADERHWNCMGFSVLDAFPPISGGQ